MIITLVIVDERNPVEDIIWPDFLKQIIDEEPNHDERAPDTEIIEFGARAVQNNVAEAVRENEAAEHFSRGIFSTHFSNIQASSGTLLSWSL